LNKEDEIRLIAYHIWEEEGRQDGRDLEHWFRAEALWEKKHITAAPVGSVSKLFQTPVVAGVNLIPNKGMYYQA
jgi:hypothetical protein